MPQPVPESLSPFQLGYLAGLLLSPRKTPHAMWEEGLLPFSPSYASALLNQDPHPYEPGWHTRLLAAPKGGFLAVDLMATPHTGPSIQGLGQVYSPSAKGTRLGHLFLLLTQMCLPFGQSSSSALVFPNQDPYPLALKPHPVPGMETPLYPLKTPSEALLDEVFDLLAVHPGVDLQAVLADAQFTSGLTLRSLLQAGVPFVGKVRTRVKVVLQEEAEGEEKKEEVIQIGELLERFPPGKARYYRRFGLYAKRVRVLWPGVGPVDLVLVHKAQGAGWRRWALVSTLGGGVQTVLEAWSLRWKVEVVHRLLKGSLGQGRSQARGYAAQLAHSELAVRAFHEVRRVREERPGLSWREAQREAGGRLREALLTGPQATSPPRRAHRKGGGR